MAPVEQMIHMEHLVEAEVVSQPVMIMVLLVVEVVEDSVVAHLLVAAMELLEEVLVEAVEDLVEEPLLQVGLMEPQEVVQVDLEAGLLQPVDHMALQLVEEEVVVEEEEAVVVAEEVAHPLLVDHMVLQLEEEEEVVVVEVDQVEEVLVLLQLVDLMVPQEEEMMVDVEVPHLQVDHMEHQEVDLEDLEEVALNLTMVVVLHQLAAIMELHLVELEDVVDLEVEPPLLVDPMEHQEEVTLLVMVVEEEEEDVSQEGESQSLLTGKLSEINLDGLHLLIEFELKPLKIVGIFLASSKCVLSCSSYL